MCIRDPGVCQQSKSLECNYLNYASKILHDCKVVQNRETRLVKQIGTWKVEVRKKVNPVTRDINLVFFL